MSPAEPGDTVADAGGIAPGTDRSGEASCSGSPPGHLHHAVPDYHVPTGPIGSVQLVVTIDHTSEVVAHHVGLYAVHVLAVSPTDRGDPFRRLQLHARGCPVGLVTVRLLIG